VTLFRRQSVLPWALLAPGLLWLLIFFAVPLYYMAQISLKEGTIDTGYQFTWHFQTYIDALKNYDTQFLRSFWYAGVSTLIALLVGYPLAYAIAFRGGKWKNALLLVVILPFFTTYLVRTLSWETILEDDGVVVNTLQAVGILGPDGRLLATSYAVIAGITYNFLPFMILPLYASLERIDPRLVEAAQDLYGRRRDVIARVVVPLSMPGIVAGVLLTFIPAAGDFINAELLGTPKQSMIGNVIQSRYLEVGDYPTAAALSFILMGAMLVLVFIWARIAGTEALLGTEGEERPGV
jgi:spermidine/putrescine transport system permease protein